MLTGENQPVHVHFLPVEDPPALRVRALALGTFTGETFYVHLTLYLQSYRELQSDQCYSRDQSFVKRHYYDKWVHRKDLL